MKQQAQGDPASLALPAAETFSSLIDHRGRRRTLSFVLVVVALSAVGWWQLLLPGFPAGLDGDLHVVRSLHLDQELRHGQIPVRWGSEQVWGYGYPTFQFFAPLPYYLTAVLHSAGLPASTGIKLLLVAGLVSGAIFTGLWARSVWGALGGMVAGALYSLNPVLLVTAYLTVAVGEIMALGLLPLAGWALFRAQSGGRGRWGALLLASLAAALMVLSHNFVGPIGLGLLALYGLALAAVFRSIRPLLETAAAVLMALALTAFFWLPAYVELPETQATAGDIHFERRTELLDLSLRYDAFPAGGRWYHTRSRDKLGAANLAAVTIAAIGLVAFRWRLDRTQRFHALFAVAALGGLVFLLVMPERERVWAALPLLQHAQYGARLLVVAGLPAALVGAAMPIWCRYGLWLAGFVVLVAVLYGAVFGQPAFTERGEDVYFTSNTPIMRGTADWGRSALPRNARLDERAPAEDPRPALLGEGTITAYEKQSTYVRATVDLPAPATLDLPLYYFPGWRAWIDGRPAPVAVGSEKGTVQVPVPAGEHAIEVRFTDTPVRRVGNALSLAAALVLILFAGAVGYDALRSPSSVAH